MLKTLTMLTTLMVVSTSSVAPGNLSKVELTVDRSDREMCEEVARELHIWYEEGGISAEDVARIVDKCFATFVN